MVCSPLGGCACSCHGCQSCLSSGHTCNVLIQAYILPAVYFFSEIGFLCCSQLDFDDVSLPKLQFGEVRRAEVLYKQFWGFTNFGT